MFKLFRPIGHLISTGILAVLTAVMIGLARFLPEFWFSFYTEFSRKAMGVLNAVTGWIPLCLWQVLLILLILSIPVGLVVALKRKELLGWLTGWLELAALLVFLFVGLWGLNHFGPTLGQQIGLEVRPYSTDELKQAASYYARQASAWSTRVERDENGDVIVPDRETLSRMCAESYDLLAAENDRFSGGARQVKALLFSKGFSYTGTTGIFLCLTGEAAVNTDAFRVDLPFTMCHELGHSLAVAPEDQANYCGYLACSVSAEPLVRYSGYYNAFLYCLSALRREDREAASQIWSLCTQELVHDNNANVLHNRQYEGKVQDTVQAVNDSYLKAFHQEAGVKSYGLVVDYLIADYLKNAQE